jgi:hypothetical protein
LIWTKKGTMRASCSLPAIEQKPCLVARRGWQGVACVRPIEYDR